MSDPISRNLSPPPPNPFLLTRPEVLSRELTGNLDLPTCPVRVRYLLVSVDTFPTTSERAQTVSDLLFLEIIPDLRIPASLQLDNGPEFIS